MISFNVNQYVLVKLTDEGLRILKRKHAIWQHDPQCIGTGKFKEPEVDANGRSRWKLRELMGSLGSECNSWQKAPFEDEILIDPDQS